EGPSVSDATLLPREVALDLMRWVAESHHVHIVDELAVDGIADHLRHLHTLIRQSADVTTAYSGALVDGIIDADERRALLAELEQDSAAKNALRRALLEDEASEQAAIARGRRRTA